MQGGTAAPKAADFPISPSMSTLSIHTSPQHLSSTLCRMEQQLRQLLSSRGQALTGDDGILDCLDYFAGRGDYVLLVTGERPRRNVVCEVRKVCDVGARGLAPCVS